MKRGAAVADAVMEAVDDMRALKTGLINRVTVHAIDPRGNHKVVAVNGSGGNFYWLWQGSGAPEQRPAEAIPLQ
jgi:L-asparaginase